MRAKVSIIVPIYNVEKYLKKGINSLLNQTLKDIQIILINDGSKDNSLRICREFEKKDNRICVIDKDNGGVSSARNAGLLAATGEYVGFMDPDDFVEPQMYENMYYNATKNRSDMCICNYFIENINRQISVSINIDADVLDKDAIINQILKDMIGPKDVNSGSSMIMASVWRFLIRKELIDNNMIYFPEGIPFMEDTIFNVKLLLRTNKLSIVKENYYHYVYNENSAMRNYKKNYVDVQRKVFLELENIIKKENIYDQLRERLDMLYVNMSINAIVNESHRNSDKTLSERIKSIKKICQDDRLQSIIKSIKLNEYTVRKRMVLLSMKNKNSIYLYLYYRLIFALKIIRKAMQ
mgnify:CR=1 FL=1